MSTGAAWQQHLSGAHYHLMGADRGVLLKEIGSLEEKGNLPLCLKSRDLMQQVSSEIRGQVFFFFFPSLSVEGEIIFLSHLVGKRLSQGTLEGCADPPKGCLGASWAALGTTLRHTQSSATPCPLLLFSKAKAIMISEALHHTQINNKALLKRL